MNKHSNTKCLWSNDLWYCISKSIAYIATASHSCKWPNHKPFYTKRPFDIISCLYIPSGLSSFLASSYLSMIITFQQNNEVSKMRKASDLEKKRRPKKCITCPVTIFKPKRKTQQRKEIRIKIRPTAACQLALWIIDVESETQFLRIATEEHLMDLSRWFQALEAITLQDPQFEKTASTFSWFDLLSKSLEQYNRSDWNRSLIGAPSRYSEETLKSTCSIPIGLNHLMILAIEKLRSTMFILQEQVFILRR